MGIDLIVELLLKALPYLAVASALLTLYLGLKRKGAVEERDRIEATQRQARDQQQARVDDARAQDAAVDARAQRPATPPTPTDRPEPGKPFKFAWLLVIFLPVFAACATVAPTPAQSVRVDVPPRPILAPCAPAPHPEARVVRVEGEVRVVLAPEDAQAIRAYLHEAEPCWRAREALLEAWGEKLANRLRAVAP